MPNLPFDRERAALADVWQLIQERLHGEEALAAAASRLETTAIEKGRIEREALANNQERELAEVEAAFRREQEELARSQAAEAENSQKLLATKRRQLDGMETE